MPQDLYRIAELLKQKHAIDNELARIIHRPALIGHLGEYLAAQIFDIALHDSASHKGSDGLFTRGTLHGRSVNVKWYAKREGLLDINPDNVPDYYLVLTGPKTAAASSKDGIRPWVIHHVFLFAAPPLLAALRRRGVQLGIATSVIASLWHDAEIYPEARQCGMVLNDEQRELLALFG